VVFCQRRTGVTRGIDTVVQCGLRYRVIDDISAERIERPLNGLPQVGGFEALRLGLQHTPKHSAANVGEVFGDFGATRSHGFLCGEWIPVAAASEIVQPRGPGRVRPRRSLSA
jgi:hypothetical protein